MSMSAKIALAALVAAAPAMATDFTATGTFSDGTTRYVRIATGDVDGDGVSDDGVIKLVCSGGSISSASIYAPRDMATGQASGKRMHKPFVFTKELDVSSKDATPLKGTYDLKSGTKRGTPGTASWDLATNKGGRSNKTRRWTTGAKSLSPSSTRFAQLARCRASSAIRLSMTLV